MIIKCVVLSLENVDKVVGPRILTGKQRDLELSTRLGSAETMSITPRNIGRVQRNAGLRIFLQCRETLACHKKDGQDHFLKWGWN